MQKRCKLPIGAGYDQPTPWKKFTYL